MNLTTILVTFLAFTTLTKQQTMVIKNLDSNNGYTTIKLNNVKIIDNFKKIIHTINITEYKITQTNIEENLNLLKQDGKFIIKPLYNTLTHNFEILKRKINALRPHSKSKRGLVNALGTGLKYLAGTMDVNDEQEIKNQLDSITQNNKNLIVENNKQVAINDQISNQIKNITLQINNQQKQIYEFLNNFQTQKGNIILKLEDEINYIQRVYQINYNIDLLKNHIDDIEQIIILSKLGILSKNILTNQELESIPDLSNFGDIKIVVVFHSEQIAIILLIPEYSNEKFSKILIEPLPNDKNRSIL